jgi:hypothetical protein
MRVAEAAEAENTSTVKGSADDVLPTSLPPQKRRNLGHISHEHARSLIVSHVLRQVLLLDPFRDASEPYGFTTDEIDSVQNSYIGYNVSTCPERLQTDRLGVMGRIIVDDPRRTRTRGHHGHK